MEKEIEINLKRLHVFLENDCTRFIYDNQRRYLHGSSFLKGLGIDDKLSLVMVARFIDDLLRFSSVFCNINSLNETDFGKIVNYILVTENGATYKINVESLIFTHDCSKYMDLYNNVCLEDKINILRSPIIQLCSDILLDEKRVTCISEPEDIDSLSVGNLIRFKCKRCGKEVLTKFKTRSYTDRYKRMLCKGCEAKQTYIKNWGVENPSQSPIIREKKATNLF